MHIFVLIPNSQEKVSEEDELAVVPNFVCIYQKRLVCGYIIIKLFSPPTICTSLELLVGVVFTRETSQPDTGKKFDYSGAWIFVSIV